MPTKMSLATVLLALLTSASPALAGMRLISAGLVEGDTLPSDQVMSGFGCSGADLSPALAWQDPPAGTKSFVLTAYDPDAPTGSGLWHWSVVNLPAATTELPEGAGAAGSKSLPIGTIQARNDFSRNAYTGACPPAGAEAHRYVFTVYALPVAELPLDETTSAAIVGFYANTSALDRASLTVTYSRPE